MRIADRNVGGAPLVIAEVGNNHLGDPDLAHRTLDAAADAGVDAVKFQMFQADELVASAEPVLKHVPDNRFATQRERFRQMMLAPEVMASLAEHARRRGVIFLCTPFDTRSADILDPLVPAFKIASGDATNYPLLEHVARKDKPMLVSTGLCTQEEVDALVAHLPAGRSILLHCVGAYPTPDEDASLAMIPFYAARYALPVGYSDHTPDLLAACAAVGLGAVAVEKHFILDRDIPGGDRALSITGPEMARLVSDLKRVAAMRGHTPRSVQASETYGRSKLRRSAYTRRAIRKGEMLTLQDIALLRPEIEGAHSIAALTRAAGVVALEDLAAEAPLTSANSRLV